MTSPAQRHASEAHENPDDGQHGSWTAKPMTIEGHGQPRTYPAQTMARSANGLLNPRPEQSMSIPAHVERSK
jgi:hypothetical protein